MSVEARTQKTLSWLRYAQQDLVHARRLLDTPADAQPYHVCFWSQQTAEKALKAALVFAGLPTEPIHDLDTLATRLPKGWSTARAAGLLRDLTRYAVDTRYPDPDTLPTASDARRAVELARRVFSTVVRDLRAHGLPLQSR